MKRKAFLANPKREYRVSNVENMIVVPIRKRLEIIMSIKAYLISWMNFDYKENGGKKNFSCKSNASILCIPVRRT